MSQGKGIIQVSKVFDAVTIAASGSSTCTTIPLDKMYSDGFFSIQVAITGDGTCKIEYLSSLDGTNFLEPTSASDIATGLTKTSGPGSDGKDIFSFTPVPSKELQIKITETGTSDSVTVTAHLLVQ